MNYDLIATLGPTSMDPALWTEMLSAGVSGLRLNTSHLSLPAMMTWLDNLETFSSSREQPVPVILDLQGSKWRLGELPSCELTAGETITLVQAARTEHAGILPVPHADFFAATAFSMGEIALNDAKVRLQLLTAPKNEQAKARVVQGGQISSLKGITLTACTYRHEQLNEKDRQIMERTANFPGARWAVSYVRDAIEMARYRAIIGPHAYLIAKLERGPALAEAARIAQSCNELWLCRGDLGAEMGLVQMARAAHEFSLSVRALPVPVLLAGQVLEQMVDHSDPTRSEVQMLYDALQYGYAGFVLSDETAIGQHPLECCRAAAMFQVNEQG